MSTTDDDIPPPPDSVIERVAPVLRAALLQAETRLSERCAAKAATVELESAAIKAVNQAHANLSNFLVADTANPDSATSQIDYYHFA
ncbi:hypothetical protein Rwratislav_47380, partial [Rhodococcus wratislaviensis IFP 2016]